MAEVFGVVAGAIGVLDVSTRGVQRLSQLCARWNHAPQELLSLSNELQDLCVILDQIKTAERAIRATSQQDPSLVTALSEQLQSAEAHIKTMNDILDELASLKKFKKKYKWVRREGIIEKLRGQIRGVREGISALLLTHGV